VGGHGIEPATLHTRNVHLDNKTKDGKELRRPETRDFRPRECQLADVFGLQLADREIQWLTASAGGRSATAAAMTTAAAVAVTAPTATAGPSLL
jgi:hypothetical protein